MLVDNKPTVTYLIRLLSGPQLSTKPGDNGQIEIWTKVQETTTNELADPQSVAVAMANRYPSAKEIEVRSESGAILYGRYETGIKRWCSAGRLWQYRVRISGRVPFFGRRTFDLLAPHAPDALGEAMHMTGGIPRGGIGVVSVRDGKRWRDCWWIQGGFQGNTRPVR